MAATRALLLLFTSACFLFFLYKFTSLYHHSLHQSFQDFIEALTIFKSNHIKPKFPNTYTSSTPAPYLNSYNDVTININDLDDNQVWPVIDETEVVVLTEKNFSEFVDNNRHVMVMFYAPSCYRFLVSRQGPDFAAAAKLLKGTAVFARVDASVEKELKMKYHIPAYPTMHFFVDGVKKFHYSFDIVMNLMTSNVYVTIVLGKYCSDDIMDWVKRKMTIGIYNITTIPEAMHIRETESEFVLGILDSLEGSDSEELAAASKLHSDINFYQSDTAYVELVFFINPQIKRPILIFTVPGGYYHFDGEFTRTAIADYISKRKDPPVITFTYKVAASLFENPMKQLLFVQVYVDNENWMEQHAYKFNDAEDAPTVVAYDTCNRKKDKFKGELTLDNIKSFAEDFLKYKYLSKSDPASETVVKLPSYSNASHQLQLTHVN
ncbi:hypothetical protein LWI28_025543 [Acer negundo]|uniref:Thioredoxin domain-containing protein n=1 Tax=Acer negundo TaxID=4023 RepID=A0AAD5IAV6_ACENE|nr:hypothetical protein LWI28_025543 [Acer negundo]